MSPAVANFLFEAGNFLLLAAALGWILFKPVRRALEAELERHARDAEEGKRLRAEAESQARDARAARDAAERELAKRREEALEAARREASQIVEEARRAQIAERSAFERELKASRDAQALALADSVGRIAAASVRRLLEALDGPSLDLALVRAACGELEAVPAAHRGSALVECARPLGPEARRLLAGILGPAFEERVVAELGAGVRVTTSAGQIDATPPSIARRAASALSAASVELDAAKGVAIG